MVLFALEVLVFLSGPKDQFVQVLLVGPVDHYFLLGQVFLQFLVYQAVREVQENLVILENL